MRSICIVGAGPAGLSAALYLSSNGIDVTVFERLSEKTYNKYHSICGAGISQKTFDSLKYIKPHNILNTIESTVLEFPGNISIKIKTKGYVLDRTSFLKELRNECEKNGCKFIGNNVTNIEKIDENYYVFFKDQKMKFTHIIGADGAYSIVREKVFKSKPKESIQVTEYIVEGNEKSFRIFIDQKYKGFYEWSFPSGNMKNIGSAKNMIVPDEYFFKGTRSIPFGSVPRIVEGNAFLIGDAAGMANPVSYGGLKMALLAGQECAKSILKNDNKCYQKWWNKNILSSKRFMEFRSVFVNLTNDELIKMTKPFRNMKNYYLCGLKAMLLHPKYAKMYFGCYMILKHSW